MWPCSSPHRPSAPRPGRTRSHGTRRPLHIGSSGRAVRMRIGGSLARIARIWPGEVCVRSSQRGVVAGRLRRGPRVGDVDGVPQVACGVVLRDVERLEVELVGLDLGALHDHEPELAEDARDLALGLADGVEPPGQDAPARQRDVGALGGEPLLEREPIQSLASRSARPPRSPRGPGLASAPTRGRSSAGSAPMPPMRARSSPLRPRMRVSTSASAAGRWRRQKPGLTAALVVERADPHEAVRAALDR